MRAEIEASESRWEQLSLCYHDLKGTVAEGGDPTQLSAAQAKASQEIGNTLVSLGVGFRNTLCARDEKLEELGQKYKREKARKSAVARTTVEEGLVGWRGEANTTEGIAINHWLQELVLNFMGEIMQGTAPTQAWPQSMFYLVLACILLM